MNTPRDLPPVSLHGVVRLKIEIVACDDRHALKILNQLRNELDVASGEKAEIHFTEPAFSVGMIYGNGVAEVIREPPLSNGYKYPEPNPKVLEAVHKTEEKPMPIQDYKIANGSRSETQIVDRIQKPVVQPPNSSTLFRGS